MSFKTIKMINFKNASAEEQLAFGQHLVQCCKQNGFLIMKDSYISIKEQEKLFSLADHFFKNITPTIREEIKYNKNTNRGLSSIGASIGIIETYNVGFENTEIPNLLTKDPNFTDFNETLLEYVHKCYDNVKDLLRAIALGCNLERDFFVNKHNENSQNFRLLHYPVIKGRKEPYAVSPHTDYGTLTMILQDHDAEFSVQDLKTGVWHEVIAERGCAIINIGDLLMRWSNDVLQSNPRRVKYTETTRSRYMTAFFAHPSYDEQITCLPTFKGEKEKYEPINSLEYLKMRIASTINNK